MQQTTTNAMCVLILCQKCAKAFQLVTAFTYIILISIHTQHRYVLSHNTRLNEVVVSSDGLHQKKKSVLGRTKSLYRVPILVKKNILTRIKMATLFSSLPINNKLYTSYKNTYTYILLKFNLFIFNQFRRYYIKRESKDEHLRVINSLMRYFGIVLFRNF